MWLKKREGDGFKLLSLGIFFLCLSAFLTAKNDAGFIRENMAKLGFGTGKISPISKGFYRVHVNKFRPGKALTHTGSFKPFYIHVKVQNRKLWLLRSTLIAKNFRINAQYMPFGIMVRAFQVPPERLNQHMGNKVKARLIFDPYLKCVKKYRGDARVKMSGVTSSIEWTINAINECRVMQVDPETIPLESPLYIAFLSQEVKIRSFNKKLMGQYLNLSLMGCRPYGDSVSSNRSCDKFIEKAESVCDLAKRKFEALDGLVSLIYDIKDFVTDQCNNHGIYDENKTSLLNLVEQLSGKADEQLGCFDEYVSDVEQTIQAYKDCLKNPPRNLEVLE